jgi:hypothetical protein
MNDYDAEIQDLNNDKPISMVLNVLKGLSGTYAGQYELKSVAELVSKDQRYTDWWDKNNDCVYNCINESVPKHPFRSPIDFKNKLEIKDRNGYVSINHIPRIEEYLTDYKINVTGDVQYFSPKQAKYTINLVFTDRHCTLDNTLGSKIYTPQNDKKIYMYYKDGDDSYKVFRSDSQPLDSKTFAEISAKIAKQTTKAIEKSDNIYVKCPDRALSKEQKDAEKLLTENEIKMKLYLHCKEQHAIFMKDAEYIKKATNGQVNIFKTGSFKKTSQKLFYDTLKNIIPEAIQRDEAHWLRMSTMGAVLYCTKGYKGLSHHADFKSFYPSIMKRQQAKYPYKRGEFQKITTKEFNEMKFYKFGIYRAIVSGEHKLFRFNEDNYYTHTDLELAKKLHFDIELIEDDQANFLYYSYDKLISGKELFSKFVEILYPLRKNAKSAKDVLNVLWGSLGEINDVTKKVDLSIGHNIPKGARIDEICACDDDHVIVKYTELDKPVFKNDFGRIVTFLLAYGRRDIITVCEPFINDIVYCRTDGFRTKTKQDLEYGSELGDLVYEGIEEIDIKNINCVKVK